MVRYFLFVLIFVAVLALPTAVEARCGSRVAKVATAPVRAVLAVKPVRRAVALPVKLLKVCRRHR